MRANDLGRAVGLALRALDSGHSDPLLFSLRAHWRKHNGRALDAVADLERALALDPGSASLATGIAECFNGLGDHRKALAAADQAVTFDPVSPAAWYQKGLAHQMLNELEEARAAYLQAVRHEPNMPDALARLAAMAEQLGDRDMARAYADRALAIQPDNDVALLAHVTCDLADRDYTAAETRIDTLIANPRTPPLTSAIALSHLGDLRDRQEHYADAVAAYRRAGALWKTVYESRIARPGQESIPHMIERLIEAVPILPRPKPVSRPPQPRLAFILGFPRSGTTLLGQILASRADVALYEEKPLLAKAIADFVTAQDGPQKLAECTDPDTYREDFWKRAGAREIDLSGKLVLEQTAFNTAYLSVIRTLFPDAPIVLALRDPRDVVFSCFSRLFGPNQFTLELHSLESTARLYDLTMRYADACRPALDFAPIEVRNEDVIADFDATIRRLCAHLDLPWDEAMRDFQDATQNRLIATRSAAQVRKGLSSESVGRWRRYRDQMAAVLPVLAPWAKRYGYDAE